MTSFKLARVARAAMLAIFIAGGVPLDATANEVIVYRGAQVWTGKAFERRDLAVRNGRFIDLRNVGSGARALSLAGRYVVPAYGNAHAHLTWATAAASKSFTDAGVFYVWNPGSVAALAAQKEFFARPDTYDVAMALGGITVRGGHPEKFISRMAQVPPEKLVGDAYHYGESPAEIDAAIDRLVRQHADFVKAYLLSSEDREDGRGTGAKSNARGINPAYASYLVKAAKKRGLKTVFHAETMTDFRSAVAAGAMAVMHMPAYNGYSFSDKTPDRWVVTNEDARRIARSGIMVVTTYGMIHGADGKLDRGEIKRAQLAVQAENLRRLYRLGATILIGTDNNGEIFTEVEHLASLGAIEPKALLGIVLGTGKRLFPERRIGCFEAGCEANFLVLRENPLAHIQGLRSIEMRIKAGNPLN